MNKKLGLSFGGKKYSLTLFGLISFTALGIMAGLLCGELLCRAFVKFPNEKKYLIFSSFAYAEIPLSYRESRLFWRPKPEFRGASHAKEKKTGTVRILCLGDSATQGYPLGTNADLPLEETYPYILEKKLRNVLPQKDAEVINAGIGGYSSLQGYHYLEDRLKDYAADIIISWFGTNDCATAIFYEDKEQRIYDDSRGAVKNIREYSKTYLFLKTMVFSRKKRVSPQDFYANCDAIRRIGEQGGGKIVFIIPFSVDLRNNRIEYLVKYKKELERLREAYHCDVIDLVPRLRQMHTKKLFIDSAHPNGEGNEIIAEMMQNIITEKLNAASAAGKAAEVGAGGKTEL